MTRAPEDNSLGVTASASTSTADQPDQRDITFLESMLPQSTSRSIEWEQGQQAERKEVEGVESSKDEGVGLVVRKARRGGNEVDLWETPASMNSRGRELMFEWLQIQKIPVRTITPWQNLNFSFGPLVPGHNPIPDFARSWHLSAESITRLPKELKSYY